MAEVENPNYMSHPMHEHPRFDHRTSAVPLACHFDGVTSIHCGRSWGKTVESGSFASLLSKQAGASIQNFLIFMVFKTMRTRNTMERIWTELIWSLYWAYQGIWPDRNSSGRKYTPSDGWRYEYKGGTFMRRLLSPNIFDQGRPEMAMGVFLVWRLQERQSSMWFMPSQRHRSLVD